MTNKKFFVSDKIFTVNFDAKVKYLVQDVTSIFISGVSGVFISGGVFIAGSVVDFVQNNTTITGTPTVGGLNPGAVTMVLPGSINVNLAYTIQIRDANGAVSNIFTKTP